MQAQGKKLAYLGIATIGVALALLPLDGPAPSAAPPPDPTDETLVGVPCGWEIPNTAFVPAGTVIVLKQWSNVPEGEHDEEVGELLRSSDAALALFPGALLNWLKSVGGFRYIDCGPCDDPDTCFVWITGWNPDPSFSLNVGEGGTQIWVEAEIAADFEVTGMCTDC